MYRTPATLSLAVAVTFGGPSKNIVWALLKEGKPEKPSQLPSS